MNTVDGKVDQYGNSTSYGWFINICNDTIAYCAEEKTDEKTKENKTVITVKHNSQMIYRDLNNSCRAATGGFYKEDSDQNNRLTYKEDDKGTRYFEFLPRTGDLCRNITKEEYFTTSIQFINDTTREKGKASVDNKHIAGLKDIGTYGCERTLKIYMNLTEPTNYLLIQKMLSVHAIPVGIVFILVGLYLMLLAQNKKATKFIMGITFSEILIFTVACGIVGVEVEGFELVFTGVGIFMGCFVGYFCLGGNKLFRVILGITAGTIFGILFFDIIFLKSNYQLAAVLLTDTILIFIGFFVMLVQLLPDFHIFLDSIVGSYVFIRGIAVLMSRMSGKVRYRELQLVLYLINRYEFGYADDYYETVWPYFWVYDLFIFIFMATSMFYYYIKVYGREEDGDKEEDPNPEEKLIGGDKRTGSKTSEDMPLE